MSQKVVFAIAFLLVALVAFSCGKSSNTIVEPSVTVELIGNSSFEVNGMFTLNGWSLFLAPPAVSVKDAPPGGGTWSLAIDGENGVIPFGYVKFTVPAPVGIHIYKFSVWTKCGDSTGVGGTASMVLDGVDTIYVVNVFHVSDMAWTLQSAIDTLKTISGDSLQVCLAGAWSEPIFDRTLFDLVKLEVIK